MNPIEEQIWNYIDGLQSEDERAATEQLINTDPVYAETYAELRQVHKAISATELEEPSMRFTANVMDKVAAEPKPVALKTHINTWIIRCIAAFFILSIILLMVNAFSGLSFSEPALDIKAVELPVEKLVSPTALRYILYADLIMGMLFIDYLIRRKKHSPKI
jgi:anti-sigma factor RsiW